MNGYNLNSIVFMSQMIGTCVDTAADYLRNGKIVAFPTETYYGLAVDPENIQAVKNLYILKKRDSEKPLLLLIHDMKQLKSIVEYVPQEFLPLMDKYWPGALTLVFPAKDTVNRFITGGTNSVGVRISPHPLAFKLGQTFGKPITATSANISGLMPARMVQDISDMFGDKVDYVLDGGDAQAGSCSTILTSINNRLKILRHGQVCLQVEDLQR